MFRRIEFRGFFSLEFGECSGSVQKSVSQNYKKLIIRSTPDSKHGTPNCPVLSDLEELAGSAFLAQDAEQVGAGGQVGG
jgi:hypothetical protein